MKKLEEKKLEQIAGGNGSNPATNIVNGIDLDACVSCMYCWDFCPLEAIRYDGPNEKAQIDESACTRCRLCESNCPTMAIHIDAL